MGSIINPNERQTWAITAQGITVMGKTKSYNTYEEMLRSPDPGLINYVTDASGDPTVHSGFAVYRYSNGIFTKIYEGEMMDPDLGMAFEWSKIVNGPTAAPSDIDAAVEKTQPMEIKKDDTGRIIGLAVNGILLATEEQIADLEGKVSGALHFKGVVENKEALPTEGNEQGDVYVDREGKEYVYVDGTGFEEFGSITDLTNYYTKGEITSILATYLPLTNGVFSGLVYMEEATTSNTAQNIMVLGSNAIMNRISIGQQDPTGFDTDKLYSFKYFEAGPLGMKGFVNYLKSKGVDDAITSAIRTNGVQIQDTGKKISDIPFYQSFQNANDDAPRKTIQLKNHDTISGIKTDGTGVNIAMVSKWDKVDLGSSQIQMNLNSKADVTINDQDVILTNANFANHFTIPSTEGFATELFVTEGLDSKVDKVEGKGLSSNDFTDAEKIKLASLENYDDTTVLAKIAQEKSDREAALQNYYTIAAIDAKIASVLRYQGIVDTRDDLDTIQSPIVGDVWHVTEDAGEYAWNGVAWEPLGSSIDLTAYATTVSVNDMIAVAKNELATEIETESQARENEDLSLQEKIAEEATTRQEQDAVLTEELNTIKTAYPTKEEMTVAIEASASKKVTSTLTSDTGTALIFNESDGGGTMFTKKDGSKSFVGVHDGSGVGTEFTAQIYAFDADKSNTVRFNVFPKGITYARNTASVDMGIEAHPEYELAVKKDIQDAISVAQTELDTKLKAYTLSRLTTDTGKSLVWNETSGGGAKYEANNGIWSFVGVNDGTDSGVWGSFYVIHQDNNPEKKGVRFTVFEQGITYVANGSKEDRDIVAHPENEIAVKGDVSAVQDTCATLGGNLISVTDRLVALEAQLVALKQTDVAAVTAAADLAQADKDLIITIAEPISGTTTVEGKSIEVKELTTNNATTIFKTEGDVTMKNLTTTGDLPKATANAQVRIVSGDYVRITDSAIDQTGYNAIEIGLGTGSGPMATKSITIDNVKFNSTLSNNAILIFATEDGSVVTISNCTFKKCSNPVRLSNAKGGKVTLNLVNCEFTEWDSDNLWAGIVIMQDYTSGSVEAIQANNLFGPDKVTINLINCTHAGEKITMPEDIATVCGTNDAATQLFYIWSNEEGLVAYDADRYPVINIQ